MGDRLVRRGPGCGELRVDLRRLGVELVLDGDHRHERVAGVVKVVALALGDVQGEAVAVLEEPCDVARQAYAR